MEGRVKSFYKIIGKVVAISGTYLYIAMLLYRLWLEQPTW